MMMMVMVMTTTGGGCVSGRSCSLNMKARETCSEHPTNSLV